MPFDAPVFGNSANVATIVGGLWATSSSYRHVDDRCVSCNVLGAMQGSSDGCTNDHIAFCHRLGISAPVIKEETFTASEAEGFVQSISGWSLNELGAMLAK